MLADAFNRPGRRWKPARRIARLFSEAFFTRAQCGRIGRKREKEGYMERLLSRDNFLKYPSLRGRGKSACDIIKKCLPGLLYDRDRARNIAPAVETALFRVSREQQCR